MKRLSILVALLTLFCTASGCQQPTKAGAVDADRAARTMFDGLIDAWLPGMSADNIADREQPQQRLEQLCFEIGQPGREADRVALCEAMTARLGPETPKPARIWLLRQLERLSGAESVAAVAPLLDESDGEVRDQARRVLQHNPSAEAAAALRTALELAMEPAWQLALVNALAARRDATAVPLLVRLTRHDDDALATAATAALGDIGGHDAVNGLYALWRGSDETHRATAAAALIQVAERLVAGGDKAQAVEIFTTVYQPSLSPALQTAALHGLTVVDPDAAVPRLLEVLHGPRTAALGPVAVRLLADLPGPAVTSTLVQELPALSPELQLVAVEALGTRGDRSAKPAIVEILTSSDVAVRCAALRALELLGDSADILVLAGVAASADREERDAARHALARLRGAELNAVFIASLRSAPPEQCAELIRALAARRHYAGVPVLFKEANRSEEVVRVAALNALGELGQPEHAATLVTLLAGSDSEAVRAAAADAVVAVCQRMEDPEQRAAPILAAWDSTSATAQPALIDVLGRVGGDAALARIRTARQADDAQLVDAAVRALAQWPSNAVLDDLLDVVEHSASRTHRVLALQGYVRLLGLPSERTPAATAGLYKHAWEKSERPDEKKAVLAGLAKVPHIGALDAAQQALGDEGLRAEAETAVLAIARLIGGGDSAAARAAVDAVLAQTTNDETRKRGNDVLAFLRQAKGSITTWQAAGPYFTQGQTWEHVQATAYPPEEAGAEVQWRALPPTNANEPWVFDLTPLDKATDRCVYVRCAVWTASAGPARLDVGSDDGVKVWLNGALVHEFKGSRSHTPLQDQVPVQLVGGWNTLLLKVVQISGQWGFSCAVRGTDGEALPEIKFQAEVPVSQ